MSCKPYSIVDSSRCDTRQCQTPHHRYLAPEHLVRHRATSKAQNATTAVQSSERQHSYAQAAVSRTHSASSRTSNYCALTYADGPCPLSDARAALCSASPRGRRSASYCCSAVGTVLGLASASKSASLCASNAAALMPSPVQGSAACAASPTSATRSRLQNVHTSDRHRRRGWSEGGGDMEGSAVRTYSWVLAPDHVGATSTVRRGAVLSACARGRRPGQP
jgi:hypothetical protein